MENEETTQTTVARPQRSSATQEKKTKKAKSAQVSETILQKVGKAAIVRHGFSAVYVTSDGQAFAQECDAKSHASDLKNNEIIKVTKQ